MSVIHKHPKEANQTLSSPKEKVGGIKKFSEWTLNDMINVSHELKWIKEDIKHFSHALKDYRNLVHPWYQRDKGIYPDENTCKICLQVMIAAITDLSKM
ncbi:MAG: hypothetical protein M1371_07040 [Actinobacteria bacterium]|nr:hypothetical protein [Actinomycetota bacterium]